MSVMVDGEISKTNVYDNIDKWYRIRVSAIIREAVDKRNKLRDELYKLDLRFMAAKNFDAIVSYLKREAKRMLYNCLRLY